MRPAADLPACFTVRPAQHRDIGPLAALLNAYMRETFGCDWSGSPDALLRDGFGLAFETALAVTRRDEPIAFASWAPSYDLHHCVPGGQILDLYVTRSHRGLGVAPALGAALAAEIRARGGHYLKGQAVPNPAVQRLYAKIAICFPGADCIVGGRAFRRLADLAGEPPRVVARNLPDRAWNHDP